MTTTSDDVFIKELSQEFFRLQNEWYEQDDQDEISMQIGQLTPDQYLARCNERSMAYHEKFNEIRTKVLELLGITLEEK